MRKRPESLNSIEKALKMLAVLALHEQGMGTGELSQELKLTMPTVSRLLHILAKHGFVQKQPEGKKYLLGKAALDIGRFAHRHIGSQLAGIARPFVDELRDAVEESAIFEVLVGDSALLVYRANGPHAVGVAVTEGMMVPAHVSPGAKAILAYSSPEVVERVIGHGLPPFTSRTITDPETFRKSLQAIMRNGIAFAAGEYNLEIFAMGAPVFDHERAPVAAVVVTMPIYRVRRHTRSKLVLHVKETVKRISDRLARYAI